MIVVGNVCNYPYQIAYGISSNYGATGSWNLSVISTPGYTSNATLAAMSGDGKYMVFVTYNILISTSTVSYVLYISSDNGLTFSSIPNPVFGGGAIQTLTISNDGDLWMLSSGPSIYYSINYGSSWYLYFEETTMPSPANGLWTSLSV
jgi:hypothetical protein